ncbi:hypothetical protein G6O67_008419 [Ophiocordyceps sinensis]|uniref:Alpha-galactosidase n=1 Tax=Ophiocordyceps sinensis TaxID=72228 RepID=A0A8H4LR39_9HYPO|nr:hypothetical protein G6O67_008419 [Ophiocordyceps sinensis]
MSTETYDFAKEFKQTYMSQQKPAPASISKQTLVQLQSHPPLGQVTPVEHGESTLTAVLDVAQSQSEDGWEVALCFSLDGAEWAETLLAPVETASKPQTLQSLPSPRSRLYFTCSLSIATSMQFTLKFRDEKEGVWKWIRNENGLDDGLLVATSSPTSGDLASLVPGLNHDWRVSSHTSHSPLARLWSLEATVLPATGEKSSFTDTAIGTPWGSYSRWFALVRVWSPWLAPRQGKSRFALDKDSVLCSFLSDKGESLVFLAFSGLGSVLTTFRSTAQGGVSVHAQNDQDSEAKATILVSQSHDFEQGVAAVMHHARYLANMATEESQKEPERRKRDANLEWQQNWFDGLGYCTWNALGQKLSEDKVLHAVQKLAEHEINITSLIIDDNWQSIDYKGLVSRIRQQCPGIQHIAVWHALLGYWGGISPEGKIAQTYRTVEAVCKDSRRRNLPLGGPRTVVAEDDVERFYNDFYRFLAEAGIDGVKTDAQFVIDTWVDASVRRDLINKYLDAWSSASFRHFGVKTISCMSQIPQALFRSQMLQDRPPLVVRNSDDFFPEIPASHPWHVWTNAHNSILTQFLNVLPDWDMFQTVHEYSGFHAAARCVSGGPIYVTDVPGEHAMDLIGQMTGVTPTGTTVIFRPSALGRSIDPYVGYDDDLLLKVGSQHTTPGFHAGILGIFNVSAQPLTEMIPLACFPATASSVDYVIRAHTTGRVSTPTRVGQRDSLVVLSLDTRGYEILCAYPLTPFTGKTQHGGTVSNLGLVGKMTGCAAVAASSVQQDEWGSVTLDTRLKALGVLGIYISAPAEGLVERALKATIRGQPVPGHLVRVSTDDDCVFEVDVLSAWEEMALERTSSNEVEVCVYFDA